MTYRLAMLCLAASLLAGCEQSGISAEKRVAKLSAKELVQTMFESGDPDMRRAAINELSKYDWGRREPYLEGYAAVLANERGRPKAESSATVRSAAVRALGHGQQPKYIKDLALALKDPDSLVRIDAVLALDATPDAQVIAPLSLTATTDPDPDVRARATRALHRYDNPDVIQTLLRILDDREFSVRYAAGASLKAITGLDLGTDADAWRQRLAAPAKGS